MSTITLNTKAYVGAGILNGISRFIERSLGILAGFSNLTASVNANKIKTTVKWKLVIPVINTDEATACACPGDVLQETIVDFSVRYDAKADPTHRADVLARIQALVDTTQFAGTVTDLVLPT